MSVNRQGPGFHLLMHNTHLLEERLRELLRPLGIHAGQARVIHGISRLKEAPQRQLASEFHVAPASMSQMIKRLAANGFIKLRKDPADKRSELVSLTPEGEQLLAQIFEAWEKVDQVIFDAVGRQNAEQLFAQNFELRNALGGKAPGTHGASDPRIKFDSAKGKN